MTLFAKVLAIANLGRAIGRNPVTGKYDVQVSADSGNGLSYGTDGNLLAGQFKAAIQLGDTQPVPAGGDGSIAYSTLRNELVQWVIANGQGSWARRYVGTSDAGAAGVPSADGVPVGYVLQRTANGAAWANVNPFAGPINGWPAGVLGGGIAQ